MVVILWDKISPPHNDMNEVILWSDFNKSENFLSIPEYLEANAERLRSKYLSFIYELGESKIAGKRLLEYFELEDGFSLWWMSRIVEKSPFKTPEIYDSLRLLALEEILLNIKPLRLEIHTKNHAVALAVKSLCKSLNIAFKAEMHQTVIAEIKYFFVWLLSPFNAMAYFAKYVYERRVLMNYKPKRMKVENPGAVFFSYFTHLDKYDCMRGVFSSRQWAGLPRVLETLGVKTRWIHHFVKGGDVSSAAEAKILIKALNAHKTKSSEHFLLDNHLNLSGVFKVIQLWLKLISRVMFLRGVRKIFIPINSSVDMWPIMRGEWYSSALGSLAIVNLLILERLKVAISQLPCQKVGFYLLENQGWERALVYLWKKYGHKKIIGVVHASVPFWHLYYHDDPRTLTSEESESFPTPDLVAVNGPVARSAFIVSGYPEPRIKNVEALRYLDTKRITKMPRLNKTDCVTNVLIIGDMHRSANRFTFELIRDALPHLCSSFVFSYKPHPAIQGEAMAYRSIKLEVTNRPLSKILQHYDVVVSGNTTSGALDASLSGVPTLVVLNGGSLNLSPLRGQRGAQFVSTSKEMAKALNEHKQFAKDENFNYYWLNEYMPLWQDFLASELMNAKE